jgi:formylglycine-generating enzyme required for sulfatase activity
MKEYYFEKPVLWLRRIIRTGEKNCYALVIIAWYFSSSNCFCQIKVTKTEILPDRTIDFVFVEGGSFLMGDVFGDGPQLIPETPVHTVELGPFFIGKYEITVADFREFTEETGYRTSAEKHEGAYSQSPYESHWKLLPFKQTDDEPVLQMSWNDAIHYCNWLSRKDKLHVAYDENTGDLLDAVGDTTSDVCKVQGYRLPTEAEWEFAARERGGKMRYGNGKDIARISEINFDAGSGNYSYGEKGLSRKRSTPVGSFSPNALGIFDMSGNAWEWCTDCAADYKVGKLINPYVQGNKPRVLFGGSVNGDEPRILRGGSMGGDAKSVRVMSRVCFGRADHCENSGFRIALSVPN